MLFILKIIILEALPQILYLCVQMQFIVLYICLLYLDVIN